MAEPAAPVLDPFLLPSPTMPRLALLVLATLGATTAPTTLGLGDLPLLTPLIGRVDLASSAIVVGAVAAVAIVLWWAYPARAIRRRGVHPLPAGALPELSAELDRLCDVAGLRRRPTFLWEPLRFAPRAVALGWLRWRYVLISGGLAVEFGRDRAAFRAIVLHELAHLRNGDVGPTYFAMATWWSFVAIVIVPSLLLQVLPTVFVAPPFHLPAAVWIGYWLLWLGAATALVYLTRNSVLQVRESLADVRAAAWEGPDGAIGRVLERLPVRDRWWLRPLRVHADPVSRRRRLDDTAPLVGVGIWEAFGLGCALGLADTDLLGTTAVRLSNVVAVLSTFAALALLLGAVAAAVLGLGLWGRALAAAVTGRRPRAPLGVGVALGLGLVIGPSLSFDALTVEVAGAGRFAGLRPSPGDLGVDVLVVGAAVLAVWWIAGIAAPWLAWRLTGRSPRAALVAGLAAATLLFGGVILVAGSAQLLVGLGGDTADQLPSIAVALLANPLGALLIAGLWALPLAGHLRAAPWLASARGWYLAGRGGAVPDWSSLRGWPGWRPVRGVRREAIAGVIVGVLFWPVYLVEAVIFPHGALASFALAAALTVGGVAGIAALLAPRPAVLRGALAGFLAACAMLPLALIAAPGTPAAVLFIIGTGLWLIGGTVVAYPSAVVGAAAGRLLRRLQGSA